MPARIPTEIKDSVVQSWLCGLTRRPNAVKHGVSEGSVDNFVNGWMVQRGPDGEYERVRALAIAFSKTGLSVQQCADGHRVAMIMKNMGVAADDYESFISKLWKRHIASGSSPDILIEQINQLYFFLENNQDHLGITTSLSELLEIIKSKHNTIKDLESKKQNLEETNQKLFIQKEEVEAELKWDSQLNDMLDRNGFKKEDVSKFVNATLLMKEQGYNIFEIIEMFSKFEKIEEACISVQRKEVEARFRHGQLLMENQALEDRKSQNSLKLRELDSLRALGFGHYEFRILRDIITEVGEATGPIGEDAVKSFFEDLRNYYYDYVRLRESVSKLKAEKAQLSAGADMIQNIFQGFLLSHPKSSGSNPKYKPDTQGVEDDKSRKSVMMIDDDMVSAKGTTAEKFTDSTIEAAHRSEEQSEGDRLCISDERREKREDKTYLFERQDNAQYEYQDRGLETQHDLVSQGGFRNMTPKNVRVVPHGKKKRSLLPPRLDRLPASARSKRSSGSNSMSSGPISNAKHHPVSEKMNELLPDMSQINNSMTETILGSMFGENSKELNEWKRRAK